MCEHVFVRWSGQTVEADEQARLPGYESTTVVRRFDAPEALETRFYEVRAKSALNRVPARSRVPFGWTVNPYRGCSHACPYCISGETPVLMGDGRVRRLAEISVGDQVYGTVREGDYLRYRRTQVLDRWISIKPAYRVALEDGTELVSSGDHRFLTDRGWKHVMPAERPGQRPFLTLNNKLMGTGGFAQAPHDSDDYRRGYLCGMVRGDGHLAVGANERKDGRVETRNRFRLALADFEALARAQTYLDGFAVATTSFRVAAATDRRREIHAIRAGSGATVEAIQELIAWPRHTTTDWTRGFLAGIFDAEGSYHRGILRICNTDPVLIDWTTFGLRRLALPFVVEHVGDKDMWNVRIRGGLQQHLRFFHLTDPAIGRKRSIDGQAVKSQSRLGVVSVEPLGRALPLYDITTGTGDYIANGVISHNCFARPTHEYLEFDAARDFEKEIVVKVNAPEVLRAELRRPSWKREHVAMGTNTDPYQWVEGRYQLMRGIWAALRDAANPCSVLTKSPLLLRDLDMMLEVAERTQIGACLSVPTLDEKAWRATEPHTPHPRARLEAVAKLNAAGIPTGVLIAPLMPGINDAPELVAEIVRLAQEAGATTIGGQTLFLAGSTRDVFFDWLRAHRPDLLGRYETLFAGGSRVPERERRRLEVAAGLPGARLDPYPRRAERFRPRRPPPPAAPPPPARTRQESLF